MFTEKNSNYFINLCRQYSDATLIPTTLRDNSVVLFSYQGEQMGLPHSQEPDAYIYNPYPNGPEFCGENPDILYAQIPIEGTTFKIYLGPVFPLGVTEEMLRNLMREQIVPLTHKEELREYIMHIPTITRAQLARHMILMNAFVNGTVVSYESIYGIKDNEKPSRKVDYFNENHIAFEDLQKFEARFYHLVATGNKEELFRFLNTYAGNIKGDRLAASELRHMKNQLIVNATKLSSISAIPAGVSSSEANKLANLYIRECENSKTVEYMEYMCLYTADGFTGEPTACDEGELAWVKKEDVLHLNLWEGDKIFFRLLNEDEPFFSLKLRYVGDTLAEAVLNGKQMELFEERSGDGTPTGTIVERGVAHSEGRCHGTAHIWIARANEKSGCEVLLQKRSAWKDSNPGCYDISSAGHLSAGDTYLEGALREIGEELGIHAEAEELRDLGLLEKVSHGVFYGKPFHDHEVSAVYLYTKPVEAEKLHLQESEVEAVRWMDLKECQKAVREGSIPNCIDIRELEMIEKAWFAGEKTKNEE